MKPKERIVIPCPLVENVVASEPRTSSFLPVLQSRDILGRWVGSAKPLSNFFLVSIYGSRSDFFSLYALGALPIFIDERDVCISCVVSSIARIEVLVNFSKSTNVQR